MSKNRFTRLIGVGAIAIVGLGSAAALPATIASAATHTAIHTTVGSVRDGSKDGQREHSLDPRPDKGNDLTGGSKDVGTTTDPRSDSGATQHDVSGESRSVSYDRAESPA